MLVTIIFLIVYLFAMYLLSKSKLRGSGLNYALTVFSILAIFFPVMTVSYGTSNLYRINNEKGRDYITLKSLDSESKEFDYVILVGNSKGTELNSLKVRESDLKIEDTTTGLPYLIAEKRTTIAYYIEDKLFSNFSKKYYEKKRNSIFKDKGVIYRLVIPKGSINKEVGFPKSINVYD